MSKENNNDLMAFHPGYYIDEIIEEMGITQEEFAIRLGTTPKTISKLVNGETGISNDLALKLASLLNSSPETWLNLQKSYDAKEINRHPGIVVARLQNDQKVPYASRLNELKTSIEL
jgi:addiction module HigA family antidote